MVNRSINNIKNSHPVLNTNKASSSNNKRNIFDIITAPKENNINNLVINKKQKLDLVQPQTLSSNSISSGKLSNKIGTTNNNETSNFNNVDNTNKTKYSTSAKDRNAKRMVAGSKTKNYQQLETNSSESDVDKLIKNCLFKLSSDELYNLYDGLPANHLFKSNNGTIFTLFCKIKNTLVSSNFQPINLVELINWPCYIKDLKTLAIDVFKIDIQIGNVLNSNEWKEVNLAKNKYLKDQFISKFVECFLDKYYKNSWLNNNNNNNNNVL